MAGLSGEWTLSVPPTFCASALLAVAIVAEAAGLGSADLKKIDVPVLVLHGDDDQIVPIAYSALLTIKLLKKGTLKVYKGYPHGMCTTHPDVINPDLLAFIQG